MEFKRIVRYKCVKYTLCNRTVTNYTVGIIRRFRHTNNCCRVVLFIITAYIVRLELQF